MIQTGDLPRLLLDEMREHLWTYAASAFAIESRRPQYRGTVTCVTAADQPCLLTAAHVWRELKSGERFSLSLEAHRLLVAAFEGRHLNKDILAAAEGLFRSGHHQEAVFAACKILEQLVKDKAGRSDLHGATLMRTVFSANAPMLVFNNRADRADRDEQEGFMHVFEGAVLALRNPRGQPTLLPAR